MNDDGRLRIATMQPANMAYAIELAADEGWNPGLHDAETFFAADPEGFLIARCDGEPIGCISAVSYGRQFGFIGLYIVAPPWRGRGYGIQLWHAAIARLAGHAVGLDGVLAQQENYRRSGFRMAYSNLRFQRAGTLPAPADPRIRPLRELPFDDVAAYDAAHFVADRRQFLRAWLAQPDSVSLACTEAGGLRGYGVIRRSRTGWKIGPLFADSPDIAEQLYLALCRHAGDSEPVVLDVPEINGAACALARKYGMTQVFGTARMYAGTARTLPVERIYGVTTFELG